MLGLPGPPLRDGAQAEEMIVKSQPKSVSFRLVFAGALILATALGLAGCNTISGAGQDVANTGHAISRSADAVENHL